ncbi:hypothetical protein ACHAXT_011433 [Thalassiosira profunda]
MASLPSSASAFTHLLALLAGIAVGKSMDADELNAYRSSNEDLWSRVRRRIKSVAVGGIVLGLVVKVGGKAVRGLLGNGGGGGSEEPGVLRVSDE